MSVWDGILEYLPSGLWITVQVFCGAAVIGLLASLLFGILRLSRNLLLRWFSVVYIEVFRGTSALVQLVWVYFAFKHLVGIEFTALQAGILVLGLNVGAYGAEVVRGSIQAVPKGQYEAALALNLPPVTRFTRIILPQAIIPILPPMGNILVELMKNTALVSFIGLADLAFVGDEELRKMFPGDNSMIFVVLLVVYFILSMLVVGAIRLLECLAARATHIGRTGAA